MASYDDTATVSGSVVSFADGADEVGLKSCVVSLPASLSGYSEVNVVRSGKNLLDTAIAETNTNNSVSITCDGNGKYTATGTATGGSANITFTLKTPCTIKSGMYLHLMNSGASGSVVITLQKQDNTTIYAPALSPANRIADLSSYVGNTIYSIRFYVANSASFEMSLTPMLCFSSTATAYEAYEAPTQYNASLGRTIYGGAADIVNGTGKTKVYKQTFTGDNISSVSITYGQADAGYTHLYFYTSGIPVAYNPSGANVVTDIGVPMSAQASQSGIPAMGECFNLINTGSGANQRPTIYWYTNQTWASIDDFKTWLNANPITVVYEVTDEETFTFDPVTIETSKGSNTFWSDQGNTELTYYKDGYGFTSVTIHKETPDGEPVEQTAKLHRIIYGGLVDVISGKAEPKNLLPMTNYDGGVYNPDVGRQLSLTVSQTQFEKTGGVYSVSTTSSWKSFTVRIPVKYGISYYRKFTLSASGTNCGSSEYYIDADGKVVASASNNTDNPQTKKGILTIPSGAKWLCITFTNRGTSVNTLTITEPQIEKGTSASDFAPHFDPFTFPPISMETDEGENTLYADEGDSAIVYRKEI